MITMAGITNFAAGDLANRQETVIDKMMSAITYANNIFGYNTLQLTLLTMVAVPVSCYVPETLVQVAYAITSLYLLWLGSFGAVGCFVIGFALGELGKNNQLGPFQPVYQGINDNRFYSRTIIQFIAAPGLFAKGVAILSALCGTIFPVQQNNDPGREN